MKSLVWPLTGRVEEMRLIERAVANPDTCGVVVCGAAGVGKSRVAREALEAAASHGAEIRWVVGTSSSRGLPLGTFATWLGSVSAQDPQLIHLVRGVIESLTSARPDTPIVVGVDDAHLLDDLSAFVLHQVVHRRAAKVVLTIRDGEPIPEGIRDIWRGAPFDRLDLQPLSLAEITALVSAALGGALDPRAARRLWDLTRGNVLYLRNIVEQEVADSRLAPDNERWRWTGDPVVPPGLVEMIESRIGTLPSSVGDVVDVLATGEPLALQSLSAITDRAAVEEADIRGLISLEPFGDDVQVRLAHPLYGEVRRRRAASTKLRRLRGLVAAELAASVNRDDISVVVRRATLAIESDLAPDPHLLVRAAQGAVWLADMALAEKLACAGARAGAGVEANLLRAHALTWLSRGQEADAVLAASLRNELTDADWGRLIFLRAQNMLFTLADPAGAKKLIDDASHSSPVPNRACIDAILTVYWALTGNPVKATESFRNLEPGTLPAIVGASTAMAYSVAAGDSGRTEEAVAAANDAYIFAQRSLDAAQTRFVIADGHIGALLQAGRVDEAGAVAEQLLQQAADLPGGQLMSSALAGMTRLGAGHLDTACALLDPVVNALSGTTVGWGYRYRLPHTIALAMRGFGGEAGGALAALEKQRHPSWRYLDYERAPARAWVASADGATNEAISISLSAAETAGRNGQFAPEVICLQAATQFGDRSCAPRLRELGSIVEGPRVRLAARFAEALHASDAAELAAVSEDLEKMGDLVAAVDAAAYAALAYRDRGLTGSGLGCSTRAAALAVQCGGANTPALRKAAQPLPLSDREWEIAMLLSHGFATRVIADKLTLSVRTVEGHIYRAMAKTGTTTRDALAALVRGANPTR